MNFLVLNISLLLSSGRQRMIFFTHYTKFSLQQISTHHRGKGAAFETARDAKMSKQ